MLQINGKKQSVAKEDVKRGTRQKFLEAFERTCGNVSASCEYAGISRQTYYRWMRSLTPTNVNFRDQLSRIRPNDRLVDLAESRLMQKIGEGDIAAIIFTLKTKGRLRGWTERNERAPSPEEMDKTLAAEKALQAYELWFKDHPKASLDEREKWLNRFADALGVEASSIGIAVDKRASS